jgi:hypothetical protein
LSERFRSDKDAIIKDFAHAFPLCPIARQSSPAAFHWMK